MTCTVCGKPHPCAHTLRSTAVATHPRIMDEAGENEAGQAAVVDIAPRTGGPAAEPVSLDDLAAQVRARSDQRTWREEVALRVDRHRARRRHPGDSASLKFDFPAEDALAVTASPAPQRRHGLPPSVPQAAITPASESLSHDSSKREKMAGIKSHMELGSGAVARLRPTKVIRFPRYVVESERASAPLITEIELAEPAPQAPRPMEAPLAQQMELLPSFADIRLDEAPVENTLAAELGLLLRPAPLGQRLASALVDAMIVMLALGIFAFGVGKVVPATIPFRAELLSLLAAGTILWLLFQYVFLVYGSGTPGMLATHLQLYAFDGGRASLRARRSRALASGLCAVSVGLGFAWVLVDEDTLGWHDRISGTYLKGS